MGKQLKDRVEEQIISLSNQQKVLSRSFAIVGLIGLCFVLFGVYVNATENTEMQRIVNPQLDWTIIGSLFIFVVYCILAFCKFLVHYKCWKLKKERLAIKRYDLYKVVHPRKKLPTLFINEDVVKELEAKGF